MPSAPASPMVGTKGSTSGSRTSGTKTLADSGRSQIEPLKVKLGDTFTAQKPAFGGRSFSGLPEFAAQEAGWNDRHHVLHAAANDKFHESDKEYFSIFLEPRDKRVVPKRQNGITRHFFPYRLPGEPDGRDDPETPCQEGRWSI